MVQLNSFYISPPMAHTEQMFYTYNKGKKENEKFMEVLMEKRKDNIDRFVERLNRCDNPRLMLDALAALLEPRLKDGDKVIKKDEVIVSEALPGLDKTIRR